MHISWGKRARLIRVAIFVVLAYARRAAAENADVLCDATQSTADTCVVVGTVSVPDGTVLRFTAPSVRVRGSVQAQFTARCGDATAGACRSDADCVAPASCLRTGAIGLVVAGQLSLDVRGEITARGVTAPGDVIGPDGGSVTITAHDVDLAGLVSVSTTGIVGLPAGRGGAIVVHADGTVTFEPTARLDASTQRGGCGGSIEVSTPATLQGSGVLTVEGATLGGAIHLAAGNLALAAALQASNTTVTQAGRPVCVDGKGGGRIELEASTLAFSGSARARGAQAGGGSIQLSGERAVTVNGTTALSVLGGDADASTAGGTVSLAASAGNVMLSGGGLEADGQSSGLGSDAGAFSITATGATRCRDTNAPCTTDTDCGTAGACVELGGDVLVEAPVSAIGGAGAGSGSVGCEVSGTGSVTIGAPVAVGGGRLRGVGGKLSVASGRDLTIGPGPITADAADGGAIILTAGGRARETPGIAGTLHILDGTSVRALGFQQNGFGGDVQLEGCVVEVESDAHLTTDGGTLGMAGHLELTAREQLAVGARAVLSAEPDGQVDLAYRRTASVAPDAVVQPASLLHQDTTLSGCTVCGNGVTEPPEECDGPGTCASASENCIPPGLAGECTCTVETCGTVPGIQGGEQCDGTDLGGKTCLSLGFAGGTLACTADCRFDTTACAAAICGDGIVGPGEACDVGGLGGAPPSFGGATCATLGFPAGGSLACTPDCTTIVTVPHCSVTIAASCSRDTDCPAGESCTAGCAFCGNGFVDPGEECDEGADNGNAPNRCRQDCRLPRCGDGIPDYPHCAGDVAVSCAAAADCAPGNACLPGEQCDLGTAACVGGTRDGASCCAEADCPGGHCSGNDCSANRNDVPGCCRCDCTLAPVACAPPGCDDGNPCTTDRCDARAGCMHDAVPDGTACGDGNRCNGDETCRGGQCAAGSPLQCDDGNPCTTDRCDAGTGCVHDAVPDGTACGDGDLCNGDETCQRGQCAAGTPLRCDDGDVCTIDTCLPAAGCQHQAVGPGAAMSTLEASTHLGVCSGQTLPRRIARLLARARALLAQAVADPEHAGRLAERARRRLEAAQRKVLHTGRRRVSAQCGSAVAYVVGQAEKRAACVAAR